MPKIDFDLDSSLSLARKYTHHNVKSANLLIVGERPTWIVLDDSEYDAFLALYDGQVLRKVLQNHPKGKVSQLLAKIHQAQFYSCDSSSRRKYPPKLTLYITNRCNLRCAHCYASAGDKLPSELTTEELLDAIEQYSQIANNGEVTISGGEPTLHPDLDAILYSIASNDHRSVLFTNGTTSGGKLGWQKLAESVDVVQLSIDGFDETTNNSIRGRNTFYKILESYSVFYPKKVQIRLSVCAMPQNVNSLKEGLLPFLNEYDPEKKIGLILSPTIAAGRNECGDYAFDYPELQNAIGDVLDEIWRSGWRFPNTFQRNDRQPRCGIGSSILIMPDGGYRACTFAPISGNIREEPLADFYSKTQEHLEQFNVDNIPMCKDCDLRHVCLGGCVVKMGHRARCTSSGLCSPSNKNFYYEKLVRESKILFGEQ